MKIERIDTDVLRLSLSPLGLVNAYVLGDVLVDSGLKSSRHALLSAITDLNINAHVITHAHVDHQGCSHAVCDHFDIPLMCGAADRAAVESGDLALPLKERDSWVARLSRRLAGPGHTVSRALREGDEVGGFVVIETPGHTPGHLALWRKRDGVLVLGDVLFNCNPMTMRSGLREPYEMATFDPAANRASARKLARLEPALVCFGHGEPLRDTQGFVQFVSTLRED